MSKPRLRDERIRRPYSCDECGREFLSVAILQAHDCAAAQERIILAMLNEVDAEAYRKLIEEKKSD